MSADRKRLGEVFDTHMAAPSASRATSRSAPFLHPEVIDGIVYGVGKRRIGSGGTIRKYACRFEPDATGC
jgi:hypothetical protein